MIHYVTGMTLGLSLAVSSGAGDAATTMAAVPERTGSAVVQQLPVFQLNFADPPAANVFRGAGTAAGTFEVVESGDTAQIVHQRTVEGHAGVVRFDAKPVRDGVSADAAYLRRPDNDALDIGKSDFTISALVRLTAYKPGANVVQKGLFADPQWKMQIDDGTPSCRVAAGDRPDAEGTVVWGGRIVLERWTEVRCQRVGGRLTIYVDGVKGNTVTASANVNNTKPLTIGGKGERVSPDQFLGYLDHVTFSKP